VEQTIRRWTTAVLSADCLLVCGHGTRGQAVRIRHSQGLPDWKLHPAWKVRNSVMPCEHSEASILTAQPRSRVDEATAPKIGRRLRAVSKVRGGSRSLQSRFRADILRERRPSFRERRPCLSVAVSVDKLFEKKKNSDFRKLCTVLCVFNSVYDCTNSVGCLVLGVVSSRFN